MLLTTTEDITVLDVPPKNRLLTIPRHGRYTGARSVAHFVGTADRYLGIVSGREMGSLYYSEVAPSRLLFIARQTEWSAGKLVKDSLADVRSVRAAKGIVEKMIENAPVRTAALRILDNTQADPWRHLADAFMAIVRQDVSEEVFAKLMEKVREIDASDAIPQRAYGWIPGILGLYDYGRGRSEQAIVHLTCALEIRSTIGQDAYLDYCRQAIVYDFRSFLWNYLALAQHQAQHLEAAQESRKRALEAGVGGIYDVIAEQHAKRTFK